MAASSETWSGRLARSSPPPAFPRDTAPLHLPWCEWARSRRPFASSASSSLPVAFKRFCVVCGQTSVPCPRVQSQHWCVPGLGLGGEQAEAPHRALGSPSPCSLRHHSLLVLLLGRLRQSSSTNIKQGLRSLLNLAKMRFMSYVQSLVYASKQRRPLRRPTPPGAACPRPLRPLAGKVLLGAWGPCPRGPAF